MKVFSKFLAVTLALLTVLTLIPISVFAKASEPWLEVEGSDGTDAPVLTVKVDAEALKALLRDDEASSSLLDKLQSGIALDFASLTQVFTATELFEIIPSEEWLKILPAADFIDAVGADEIFSYIELETMAPTINWETIMELVGENAEEAKKYLAEENGSLSKEKLEQLIEDKGLDKVLNAAPTDTLLEQFTSDELYELISKTDLKPYAKELLALFVRKIFSNVDELTIDGEIVASEDEDQALKIHSAALVEAINKLRPSLDDFVNNEDGKLLSTRVALKYTVDGTNVQKSKEMILEVVVDGDLSSVQNMAKKVSELLNRYVSYSYNNGTLSADVTLPAGFAKLFNRILDTDLLDADTKEKILNVANWDGEYLTGVLEGLTVADVVEILGAFDIEEIGELALQNAYVQKCLEVASKITGVDMSDMDVNELLDYSVTIPGLKDISDAILARYGVDVYAALQEYETAGELYAAALKKAEASEEIFEMAIDKLLGLIETYIPASAMNLSLMDGYNGNGNFTASKTLTFNPKDLAVKALNRLVEWSGLDIDTEAFELLLSQVSGGTKTLKLDLSLNVTDVYSITYKDKATDKTLFTAFLPVGADLSVFQNKEATGGVEITEWMDEEGNPITTMPARDVVVYTGRKEVTVTFVDKDGSVKGSFTVLSGDTLAEHLDAIYAIEDKIEKPNGTKTFVYDHMDVTWNVYNPETGETGSRWMLTRYPVVEDMTVIADTSRPSYYLYMEDVDYDVILTEDGSNKFFTIKVHEELPESFSLNMHYTYLLSLAAMSYNVELTMVVGKDEYEFFKMDDVLLTALKKASKKSAVFNFGTTSANAANSIYATDANASFFTFEILLDDVVYGQNFESDLIFTLPYENALTGADGSQSATRIHLLYADGTRELVERLNDEAGYVSFKAPHFSEYVVSNEYRMNIDFVSTEASDPTEILGSWRGEADITDTYFPAGCEITAIPQVFGEHAKNYTWVSTDYKVGEKSGSIFYGDTFVMPAAEVDVTVTVKPRVCNVYYYVLGAQFYKDTYFFYETIDMRAENDSAVMAKDPDGTPSAYKWIGFDKSLIGVCDMYVSAKWNDATYFVEFLGRDGKPIATLAFDESSFYTVVAPALPLEKGYVGAWSAYDLTSAFGKEDGYTITVASVYTEAIFKIFSDGNVTVVGLAKFGDTVKVSAPDKIGYDKVILVTLADKSTQTVENGVFVMPESEVYVDVSYVPHSFNYTINGFEYQGKMNDTVTFEITLPRGKVLKKLPAGCTLAEAKLASDGSLVLTYSFELIEDDMAINWKWEDSKYNMLQIINGKLFDGNGVPVSTNDDALFLGWSPVVADNVQFAIFGINEEPASWLWLWILLVLLVLIGVIVLFYLLYKAGKIGLNGFTRVILWIVNLFFTVCIAVAELGLKIAGLFSKADKKEN